MERTGVPPARTRRRRPGLAWCRHQAAGQTPLPPAAEHTWWYLYYFATERGRAGYEKYRREFSKLIWQLASPKWAYAGQFTGKYQHRVIGGGVGHNLPQEAPRAFAQAIIDADRL
jgi:hypothetical protein